jgi:Domain of unknown function (DUF4835)
MKINFSIFLLFLCTYVQAQEIDCKVTINSSQLEMTNLASGDKQIFPQIEQAIKNFMNTQRWTTDIFSEKEKIKCNLSITLLKVKNQYSYSGNAQFQVTRPIYGTTYETVLLQYIDRNFEFSFAPEERTMLFNEQTYINNLTSTLAYYSLIAVSLDYDSFSKFGGNPYIERAFNVANVAGNAIKGPWLSDSDPRSRFHFVENLRNQIVNPYREGFYTYHRLVLDDFANNTPEKRKLVLEFLNTIKTISTAKPQALLIRNFFDSKAVELVNIFSASEKPEKQEVYKLLTQLDPTKSETYRQILK